MNKILRPVLLLVLALTSAFCYAQAPHISYATPQTYYIGDAITPLSPTNTGGAVTASSQTILASNVNNPVSVALDAAGNVYFVANGSSSVGKIPAGGGSIVAVGSGYNMPTGVAVDGAGNVYVADFGNNSVKKIAAGSGTITTYASINSPYGLALDGAGNLYVTDRSTNTVKKIPAGGGAPVIIASGFNAPTGIAVDGGGNVFVCDRGNNAIKKIDGGGNVTTVTTGDGNPNGVAVDAAGNIYFADTQDNAVIEVPQAGGGKVILGLGTGFSSPSGIAVTANGDIYVADSGNGAVVKLNRTGYTISQALPPGLLFDNNTGVISGTPTALSPATDYTIFAYNHDGASSTTINVQVLYDASLSNLTLSAGTLNPAFAQATTSYTATVAFATSSITLTPTADHADAVIKVNGTTVTSGSASGPVALNVGSNAINTVVTSPDGTTTKTYTLTVTRAASSLSTNAKLSTITTTPAATLTITTGPGYKNYTTTVANSVTSIQVTPTAQDATATITVNGQAVASGALSQAIALSSGANTITIAVTAQDGATIKNYIITVTRTPSAIATLSNITLSAGKLTPVFAPATTSYSALVPNIPSSITLTPTATEATATIKVNGTAVTSGTPISLALAVGSNTITTVVTAGDGITTKTYTVTITRAAANASDNALLSSIFTTPAEKLSNAVVTGNEYKYFTTSVPASVASIQVTPTAEDANAFITVNGQAVASGTLSQAVALDPGDNIITISVTAPKGVTVKNYIITVTRPAPADYAVLSSIVTTPKASLTVTTGPGYRNYTASVLYAVHSIQVTPTATKPATIKVNGTTVASGALSPAIALNVGSNTINITVTGQNGMTLTYIITITRAVPSTNAILVIIATTPKATLNQASGSGYKNYTASVANSVSSIKITPTAQDATANIKVNGTTVPSGTLSQAIALTVGTNTITIAVTAQDGVTLKNYIITVTRAPAGMFMKYDEPGAAPMSAEVTVHQGLSPNGDGHNDVLTIDGIENYPDNNLQIINRSGQLVYQAKGYDNSAKVFDGHASTTGRLQLSGTYFYSLDYKDGNETKHKTGFIVLKY